MFYTFRQNNSGCTFHNTNNVAPYVIIEADSADEANRIAQEIGIYFNGCDDGIDCPCCGDRWIKQYKDEGNDTPCIYGTPIDDYKSYSREEGWNRVIIYYKNGNKVVDILQQREQRW